MGQYYTPVIMKNDKISTFLCYDYDNGAKLMEHSYIGNKFVETVLKQLYKKSGRLAWVGDYASDQKGDSPLADKFIEIENQDEKYRKHPKKISNFENSMYITYVNHTKKEYIRIHDYIIGNGFDKWGMIIHPIPLLTAIGNGQGGGDYWGTCENMVGRWACDEIEAVDWFEDETYKNITDEVKFKEGGE